MTNKTYYEWDFERYDLITGDILDHDHAFKLTEFWWQMANDQRLVLVWNLGSEEGLVDRAWAYVQDGILPEKFDNGRKVPKRFQKEFEEWTSAK